MIVHLEDRKAGRVHPAPGGGFLYRQVALCGEMFYAGDREHTFACRWQPEHIRPTCENCIVARRANKRAKRK